MNKKTKIIIGAIILAIGVFIGYQIVPKFLGGIESMNLNYYQTATNTSIACSGATSTLILAASGQGQRFAFDLVNASGTQITLCKAASGCIYGSGLILASSTGSYSQEDAYYGAFSCNGGGATSTVRIIYAQN